MQFVFHCSMPCPATPPRSPFVVCHFAFYFLIDWLKCLLQIDWWHAASHVPIYVSLLAICHGRRYKYIYIFKIDIAIRWQLSEWKCEKQTIHKPQQSLKFDGRVTIKGPLCLLTKNFVLTGHSSVGISNNLFECFRFIFSNSTGFVKRFNMLKTWLIDSSQTETHVATFSHISCHKYGYVYI